MDLQFIVDNFKTIVTRHYADFEGRIRRRDFWLYVFAVFILSAGLNIVSLFGGMRMMFADLLAIALMLPNIGASVRRLHDSGRSGWLLLLAFIPVLGWLALIYFYLLEGETGTNRFGPDPKGAPAA